MVIFDNGHLNILPDSRSEKTFGNVGGQLVCCKECKTSDMIKARASSVAAVKLDHITDMQVASPCVAVNVKCQAW